MVVLAGLFIVSPVAAQDAAADGDGQEGAQDNGWPQVLLHDDSMVTVYQPQLESWQDNVLQARSAVSVKTKAAATPAYGVVFFSARTEVDRSSGMVGFEDLKIINVHFPGSTDEAGYRHVIEDGMPGWPRTMALERLEADLAITKASMKTQRQVPVENNPPRIIFSQEPSILVLVDGTPVPRPVEGSELLRIINTRALILLDKATGIYWLYITDHWEQSKAVEGPWSRSSNPPASLDQAKAAAVAAQQVDLLDGTDAGGGQAKRPPAGIRVFVSTVPAELFQSTGAPDMQPVDGTQLLSVKNSEDYIFLNMADNKYYVLASGRWYRSRSLQKGPWEFVPGGELPGDFRDIPVNHPKGDVLASVPGTPQAQEAVISDSIPQTATVNRNGAQAEAIYDGEPRFEPIEGTLLYYAVNSPLPIIRVDGASYYMVLNGVWFTAGTPKGVWRVADTVPAAIYTIPPGNRLHYVTYVKVYGATPDVVYTGYTPGYYGSYVGIDGTVVYGTGYYYTPWVGTAWYGPPVTWGTGIHYGWYGSGWGWGYYYAWRPVYRPWWGPCWGWHPGYPGYGTWRNRMYMNANVYNRWSNRVIINNYGYNPGRNAGYTRGVPPDRAYNDHFADHEGNVYRRGASGWERNQGGGQWYKTGGYNGLGRDEEARNEGAKRAKVKHPKSAKPKKGPSGMEGHGGSHGGGRR